MFLSLWIARRVMFFLDSILESVSCSGSLWLLPVAGGCSKFVAMVALSSDRVRARASRVCTWLRRCSSMARVWCCRLLGLLLAGASRRLMAWSLGEHARRKPLSCFVLSRRAVQQQGRSFPPRPAGPGEREGAGPLVLIFRLRLFLEVGFPILSACRPRLRPGRLAPWRVAGPLMRRPEAAASFASPEAGSVRRPGFGRSGGHRPRCPPFLAGSCVASLSAFALVLPLEAARNYVASQDPICDLFLARRLGAGVFRDIGAHLFCPMSH